MKKIITAIGNEELNNVMKGIKEVVVKNSDIQYQEGILEALDKYTDINILILKEDIFGNLDVNELIRQVKMLNEKLQIILITANPELFKNNKYITKIVNNKNNYVKEILEYVSGKEYIKQKNETKEEIEKFTQTRKDERKIYIKKQYERIIKNNRRNKNKINKDIITVIGMPGIRQNNIYFNTC